MNTVDPRRYILILSLELVGDEDINIITKN